MKERPILFSAPMVTALLAGTKTQTRRKVNPRGALHAMSWSPLHPEHGLRVTVFRGKERVTCPISEALDVCPYGVPGDRLWVRETHYRFGHWEPVPNMHTKGGRQKWRFVADYGETLFVPPQGMRIRLGRHHKDPSTPAWHVRLARFMPRELSRLMLEVASVRVERLHEITEEDARAEGVRPTDAHVVIECDAEGRGRLNEALSNTHRGAFACLWDSINGGGAFAANPWLWVVGFKRLEVSGG